MRGKSRGKLIVLIASFLIFIVGVYALYMDDDSIYRTPLLTLSFVSLSLLALIQSYRAYKNGRKR